MRIKIESPASDDGVVITHGTRVVLLDEQGGETEVQDVSGLTVNYPLNGLVEAHLSVNVNPETVEANAVLSLETVKECAAFHGYELVKR